MVVKGVVERSANPSVDSMLNVYGLHLSAPEEEAMSRICTSKTRRNLQTFGWCLQFKPSCSWGSLSYFCMRKKQKNLLLFIEPQTARHHQLRGLKNIYQNFFLFYTKNIHIDRQDQTEGRLVAAVVAASAAGAGAVSAGVPAAASGRRATAAVASGSAGDVLVVARVVASVAPTLAEVSGKQPLPPSRPPRLKPQVKTGMRSPPDWREELAADRWLPEEEPDSERFFLPPPSAA